MTGSVVKEPFHAKATTVGNSRALQLEAALVRGHPELADGRFDVYVVAPGRFLIVSAPQIDPTDASDSDDPLLGAFLGFLNREMQRTPTLLRPLFVDEVQGMEDLVRDVAVDDPDTELEADFVMP